MFEGIVDFIFEVAYSTTLLITVFVTAAIVHKAVLAIRRTVNGIRVRNRNQKL